MAIPIRDNTTALESLKTKAQNLPDRESGSSSGSGGVDTSDATVQSADVLYGKVFYGADGKSTGTMTDNSGWVQEISINGTYRLPNGYHKGSEVRVAVPSSGSSGTDTSDATAVSSDVREGVTFYNANGKQTGSMPDAVIRGGGISVNDDLLTADVIVDIANSGYIEAGNKVTHKMNVYSNDSVTPSSSDKTLATAGKYTMSNIIVKGDSNLVAENIKSGVSIFGVTGTYGSNLATNIDKISVTASSYASELSVTANRSDIPSGIIIKNNTVPTGIANSSYTILLSAMYDVTADGYYDEMPSVVIDDNQSGTKIHLVTSYWGSVLEKTADTSQLFVVIPSDFSTSKTITIDYMSIVGGHTFNDSYSYFWGNYDVYLIYD